MRAVCGICGGAQPPDWSAGDLCVLCGGAVRLDVRCFWCATWVPPVGFCRSCGAAVVDRHLYGAARMLKDGGVDCFSVPKMLAELDPAQLENLGRLYERQAALVARHVDEVVFLERFLFQKHWSSALEDELTGQLPWPRAVLARFDAPAPPAPEDDASRARLVSEGTPIPQTRSLAMIARLRLDDWSAFDEVRGVFHQDDTRLRAEAALALSGWRVRYGVDRAATRGASEPGLVGELHRSPFRAAAAVRLALLGEKVEIPPEAASAGDPDLAMAAALVSGNTCLLYTSPSPRD